MARIKSFRDKRFPHGSLRGYMISGGFWSIAGSIVSRGMAILAGIFIARIAGREGFGKWGMILTAAAMFAMLVTRGIATTATKHIAELKVSDPARAGRILSLLLVFGSVCALGLTALYLATAGVLAEYFVRAPELAPILKVASLMVLFLATSNLVRGILGGFQDFRRIAAMNMAQGFVLVVAVYPLTKTMGLTGTALASAGSFLAATIVGGLAIPRQISRLGLHVSIKGMWREARILWHFGVPGFLTAMILGPTDLRSQAIAKEIPGGWNALGGFRVGYQWRQAVLFIPMAVQQVTLPMLSKLRGEDSHKRFVKAFWASIALSGGVALASALPLMLLSKWILSLYGPEFPEAWDIMVLLLISGVFQAVNDVVSQVATCMEKIWWIFAIHVVWGAGLLGGTHLLAPRYGIRGYAWVWVIVTVVHMSLHGLAAWVLIRRSARAEAQGEPPAGQGLSDSGR